MATDTKKPRVTYPLSVQEVEKLESLEKQLKTAAEEAAKNKRVGFHRSYLLIMRSLTKITIRERSRMKREEAARQNRKSLEMKIDARQNPESQQVPIDDGKTE